MEASHVRTIVDMSSSTMSSEKPGRISISETDPAKQSPSKVRALHWWLHYRRADYTSILFEEDIKHNHLMVTSCAGIDSTLRPDSIVERFRLPAAPLRRPSIEVASYEDRGFSSGFSNNVVHAGRTNSAASGPSKRVPHRKSSLNMIYVKSRIIDAHCRSRRALRIGAGSQPRCGRRHFSASTQAAAPHHRRRAPSAPRYISWRAGTLRAFARGAAPAPTSDVRPPALKYRTLRASVFRLWSLSECSLDLPAATSQQGQLGSVNPAETTKLMGFSVNLLLADHGTSSDLGFVNHIVRQVTDLEL
ncbi:unnamed protein product [Trichogramma brassicae]|uniref:Uncharacterized protein n=1 Tax=Trichogramma brassicae TaxID=86971 RepID=A0A6H5HUJ2_9HYME|nr:unnamed protein product [Trichogramma brassicae]